MRHRQMWKSWPISCDSDHPLCTVGRKLGVYWRKWATRKHSTTSSEKRNLLDKHPVNSCHSSNVSTFFNLLILAQDIYGPPRDVRLPFSIKGWKLGWDAWPFRYHTNNSNILKEFCVEWKVGFNKIIVWNLFISEAKIKRSLNNLRKYLWFSGTKSFS